MRGASNWFALSARAALQSPTMGRDSRLERRCMQLEEIRGHETRIAQVDVEHGAVVGRKARCVPRKSVTSDPSSSPLPHTSGQHAPLQTPLDSAGEEPVTGFSDSAVKGMARQNSFPKGASGPLFSSSHESTPRSPRFLERSTDPTLGHGPCLVRGSRCPCPHQATEIRGEHRAARGVATRR